MLQRNQRFEAFLNRDFGALIIYASYLVSIFIRLPVMNGNLYSFNDEISTEYSMILYRSIVYISRAIHRPRNLATLKRARL